MIGLKRGIVKLVKTKAIWRASFKKEEKKLRKLFGKDALDIQHVGSTAIPGILAKPVIDIGIAVLSLRKAGKHIAKLEKIGYVKKREKRRDRLFFVRGPENKRTHYLHVGEAGSGYVEDMVLFRDYLQKDKKAARGYGGLKKKLAEKYSDRRYVYTEKKKKFVEWIVKKAKESTWNRG